MGIEDLKSLNMSDSFSISDNNFMQLALLQARAAELIDEVPVGAVLVATDGTILAETHNRTISLSDPCAHAEILALRNAGKKLSNYRLLDTTLYVTLEPCAMCAMALVHARVKRLVYATKDPKTGACGSVFDLINDPRHNHQIQVRSGILADEAGKLLSDYFRNKRLKK